MIILPDYESIIITPPKCASTSLHFGLHSKGIWCIGPQGDGKVDKFGKHTTVIPYEFSHYKRFVCVRPPKQRFISLYKHYARSTHAEYREFVKIQNDLPWFFNWTLDRFRPTYEGEFVHVTGFIYTDRFIDSQLEKLIGIDVTLPRMNDFETSDNDYDVPESWLAQDFFN